MIYIHFIIAFVLIGSSNGIAEEISADNKYPTTAEGVVEAFVKSDFDGSANEVVGDVKNRMKYVSWVEYPGTDCFRLAEGFKVRKTEENAASARVEVKYALIGSLCGYDSFTEERVDEVVTFTVVYSNSVWKIDYPDPPPVISPPIGLRILQHKLFLLNSGIENRQTKIVKTRINGLILKLNKYISGS